MDTTLSTANSIRNLAHPEAQQVASASPNAPSNQTAPPLAEASWPIPSPYMGPPLPPDNAEVVLSPSGQRRLSEEGERPTRVWHSDETGIYDGAITIDDKVHRVEKVYFSSPPDSLCEAIEDMPVELSRILGVDVEELATADGLNQKLKSARYQTQLEAKRYLNGLYARVRQEPHVIKEWTFEGKEGSAHETDYKALTFDGEFI
ncbi:hypothetical protein EON83_29205 [bacterium]|nr:MAG: hypothetical protein EON83_29205 [bacterium]